MSVRILEGFPADNRRLRLHYQPISDRELEVFRLIGRGLPPNRSQANSPTKRRMLTARHQRQTRNQEREQLISRRSLTVQKTPTWNVNVFARWVQSRIDDMLCFVLAAPPVACRIRRRP